MWTQLCGPSVDYADLPIIDFAKLDTPGGSAELAKEVHDAMTTSGFLYVVNHGHSQAQVCLHVVWEYSSAD